MFVDGLVVVTGSTNSFPITLTLKSNGCTIFMAALSPSQLVVTPKHSLYFHNDSEKSHTVVGERWLEKHLKDKGKEELAKTLWDDNLTAIAGVCPLSLYFFTY